MASSSALEFHEYLRFYCGPEQSLEALTHGEAHLICRRVGHLEVERLQRAERGGLRGMHAHHEEPVILAAPDGQDAVGGALEAGSLQSKWSENFGAL